MVFDELLGVRVAGGTGGAGVSGCTVSCWIGNLATADASCRTMDIAHFGALWWS